MKALFDHNFKENLPGHRVEIVSLCLEVYILIRSA